MDAAMLSTLPGAEEVVREMMIRVNNSEARAMQRCLTAEQRLEVLPVEKVVRSYFDRPGHPLQRAALRNEGHIEIRATMSDTLVGQVLLEMRRIFGQVLRSRRLCLPRHTLRAAMRPNVARELLPGMPTHVEPAVLLSCYQRTFRHPDGWHISFGRELCVYRPPSRVASMPMTRAIRLPGVRVCITISHGALPDWLEHVSRNAERFDEFTRAMSHLASAQEPQPNQAWVH